MSAGLLLGLDEGELHVPSKAMANLAAFREWALSSECPDNGRVDYISGTIEVNDVAGEELFAHGLLKGKLYSVILARVEQLQLGYAFTDSTRVSSLEAKLSAEPDVVVVSYNAIESGRVRLVPKSTGEAGRYVEIEGAPDLIVEVVSDGTVRKDSIRLPQAYFAAGVKEFWLADGRKQDLTFAIHTRGESGFIPVKADRDGFQASSVLGQACRLDRTLDRLGAWRYELSTR